MVEIEPARSVEEEIRTVVSKAFADDTHADLVTVLEEDGLLRADCSVLARDGSAVGYAAVSEVELPAAPEAIVVALGPVAVLPPRQGEGIRSQLVRTSMRRCVTAGIDAVVAQGDPSFFDRFGFERADAHGLSSDLDPPPGTFQVWPCRPDTLDSIEGQVRHPAPFHAL